MSDEPHLTIVPSDPLGTRLHEALQQTLAPPLLPEGFRVRVLSQVLDDQLQQVEARRLALELEHFRAMQQLRRGHAQLQRDTLALITVCAFAAGTCAHLAVPWINETFNLDSALTVPMIALVIGLASGASAWVERFGNPGKLFGVGTN
jgi:hypothetical protein